MAIKPITIFTFLNQIYYKKKTVPYDKKMGNAYMLSLWLSHDPSLIHIVQKINHLQFSIKDDKIYQYYYNMVPKGRRYIKWTKKIPEDKTKAKIIERLMEETKLSKNECKRLIPHMMKVNKKERSNVRV